MGTAVGRQTVVELSRNPGLPALDRPVGIPDSYEAHVKLMFDLADQAAALRNRLGSSP